MRVVLPALLLASACGVGATTLVAVWSPERLILGADSLMVTDTAKASACKIEHEGPIYFALSGLVQDRTAGFDLAPLARAAMKESGAMAEKLNAFVARVRSPLSKAVLAVKHQSPGDYEYLQTGHPVIQAIFGQMQEGTPVLGVASFELDPEGNLREYASVLADGNDNRGPRIIYAGQQQRIREFIHSHPDWYSGDTVQLTRNLIQMEIDSGTGRVGGPVDIVTIEPNRAEWLQKKAGCGD